MKQVLFFLITLLVLSVSAVAQDPPRRDTAWGDWPHQEYYNSILDAPVVTGETTSILITPSGQQLCFDKRITVKTFSSAGPAEQCLYLNTKDGYVGMLPPSRGTAQCDIKPDDPNFLFFVLGLKGNAYTFKNNKKNGNIEHHVMTGNTMTHQVRMTGPAGEVTVYKKTERRGYCGDKIKTYAYKYDNPSSPVYFLFGKTFPAEINISSNKYIGNLGIGYQFTDKGLFIIMEMESSGYTAKINDLEEVNVCFDPSSFRVMEDVFYESALAGIQKEKDKIARDEARATGDCGSQKMQVINFRKEQVRLQEERLTTAQQGNVYDNVNTQKALAGLMDYAAMSKQAYLETQVSICQAQKRLSGTRSEQERTRLQEKIACLSTQAAQWQSLETQLRQIDVQYASEPGRAQLEKTKKFSQDMPRACN